MNVVHIHNTFLKYIFLHFINFSKSFKSPSMKLNSGFWTLMWKLIEEINRSNCQYVTILPQKYFLPHIPSVFLYSLIQNSVHWKFHCLYFFGNLNICIWIKCNIEDDSSDSYGRSLKLFSNSLFQIGII